MDQTKDLRGSRSLLFISFKKGHTSDIRPATLSSWLKQTILLCYKQADQQALLKLKRMTSGPSRPLRPFTVGYRWTNHASLSLESSQHIYKLPKRPYLVRQRQQYVSGTRSGGTTSPRSFPSDQLSSERKKGGGGAHPLQPSLQESLPGSRYSFTFKMLPVRSFFLVIKVSCIKD